LYRGLDAFTEHAHKNRQSKIPGLAIERAGDGIEWGFAQFTMEKHPQS
jgi:hypothetical protein